MLSLLILKEIMHSYRSALNGKHSQRYEIESTRFIRQSDSFSSSWGTLTTLICGDNFVYMG
jgi:hypothetical protein